MTNQLRLEIGTLEGAANKFKKFPQSSLFLMNLETGKVHNVMLI
jgi:hypothetical protein